MSAVLERPPVPAAPLPVPPRYHFARGTAAAAFLVIFAGGMVTSTGSALAVPDWPLAYGQFFPRMVGGVLFEHGHRMLAGVTALLVWALAVWTHKDDERPWARAMTAVAALGILAQAVLGGATVLWGLPPQVSIVHACLGQALFALLAAFAQAVSPWFTARPRAAGRPWLPYALGGAALFVQLALGATLRHTGTALPWHLAGAALAFWAVSRAALQGVQSDRPELEGPSSALMGLLLLQVFLGFGALAVRHLRLLSAAALLPTAHQALGALLLALCAVLALRASRAEAS
ncbi:MAG: COX15/CtaA family protein [Elusimicrobia bacterium]|nr:COX15/CtaA family protein [Elusimicrobiota bacterium]